MEVNEPGSPAALANEPQMVESGKKRHGRKASGNRGSAKGKTGKVYAPYRESEGILHISQKVTRSPAKIRIAASVKNQPPRADSQDPSQGGGGAGGSILNESGKSRTSLTGARASQDLAPVSSAEKLEPYLKASTPVRPMKNFVSTVSYLRPATDSKQIVPTMQHVNESRMQKGGKP